MCGDTQAYIWEMCTLSVCAYSWHIYGGYEIKNFDRLYADTKEFT